MNKYYPLIDKLIYIKDHYELSRADTEAINDACNVLQMEGNNAQDEN